ncbi:hypothetical protein LZ32DRAFT_600313 [Colletotrichum eremochloae]|nr:hypothetical protein LZ32DRAFT_600313 [Colletotrichum eremochloae]
MGNEDLARAFATLRAIHLRLSCSCLIPQCMETRRFSARFVQVKLISHITVPFAPLLLFIGIHACMLVYLPHGTVQRATILEFSLENRSIFSTLHT